VRGAHLGGKFFEISVADPSPLLRIAVDDDLLVVPAIPMDDMLLLVVVLGMGLNFILLSLLLLSTNEEADDGFESFGFDTGTCFEVVEEDDFFFVLVIFVLPPFSLSTSSPINDPTRIAASRTASSFNFAIT
jgi:hypothetical protein